MIFSMILSNTDNRDIGLKLFRSCVEPPLCNGTTLPIFNLPGITPFEKVGLIN